MIEGYRVFDAHVHMQPWRMLRPEVYPVMVRGRSDVDELVALQSDPGAFERYLAGEGVDRAVCVNYVSPHVMGFGPDVNDWVAAYCRGRPRLVPMGSVHPRTVANVGAEAERLVKLGIQMFKVHPAHQLLYPNDACYRPLYEVAEKHGIPVTIHTGTSIFPRAKNTFTDPLFIDDIAADHPSLPLLVAHAGRPLWGPTAFFLARRHANVYIEISGIPPTRLFDALPRLAEIPEKIVWGTDWPSPGIRSMRQNVLDLLATPGLSDAAKGRILWDNAAALVR
ncbi:MAG TPA: amidohydrolase family protein [Candidatus Thermoplasmatota archaeon]|nr:amidohydrolase family protein [Candidatus Thermoplasmatota archaeon]